MFRSVETMMILVSVIILLARQTLSQFVAEETINPILKKELQLSMSAPLNKVMHQASIRYKIDDEEFGTGHVCGGSLITYRTVLTAAHCLYFFDKVHNEIILVDPSEFRIVLGTLRRTRYSRNTLIYNAISLVHHPKYDLETGKNDIGIIVMDKYVPINHPTVRVIALPMDGITELKDCYLSGWATTGENGVSTPSDELVLSYLNILSPQQCEINYKGELYPGFNCAGTLGNESEPCGGDDGGPIVCGKFLIGVLATGYKCNNIKKPSLYTDVSYYLDWIRGSRDKRVYFSINFKTTFRWSKSLMSCTLLLVLYVL